MAITDRVDLPPKPLTTAQAAQEIGVHHSTVCRYVAEGFMQAYCVLPGGQILFDPSEVERVKHTRRPHRRAAS